MKNTPLSLRPFQKKFVRGFLAPGKTCGVLSIPRGNGKSTFAAHLVARVLSPGDPLYREGLESVLCAASLEQARIVFKIARRFLGEKDYRYLDSTLRIGINHLKSNTRLRVISSSGKTAMGIVDCPIAIMDEPGAMEIRAGSLLWDALATARSKPNSPLRILVIGTLAPMATGPGHWFYDLVENGSTEDTYVQSLRGDSTKWDKWPEIRRVNPLANTDSTFRKGLLRERDEARGDNRLKARFLSYRLNLPAADESVVLLSVPDWKRTLTRKVPPPSGKPIVGVDLGGGRAWSAAAAIWQNGRCESLAIAPGIPSLIEQEKRDKQPPGTYQRIKNLGIAEGKRVPPVGLLVREIYELWGRPARIICDRFRLAELQDEIGRAGPFIEARQARWSEAAADIRALRKMAADGPLAVEEGSRSILQASLSVAQVKNDDQGSVRLVKKNADNSARDDAAAALVLAAGGWDRASRKTATPPAYESSIVG